MNNTYVSRAASAAAHVPMDFIRQTRDESHRCHADTHSVLRRTYVATHGRSRRALRAFYRLLRPVPPTGSHLRLIEDLSSSGVGIVPAFLDSQASGALQQELSQRPGVRLLDLQRGEPEQFENASGVRLVYETETLLEVPGVLELVANPFFQEVAGDYFGSVPIFTGVNAWWSLPKNDATPAELDLAAQQFHFDYDWPMFLKFFIYLTDVGPNSGPFTYVEGTHERKAEWRDGRLDDHYISTTYGEQVRPICGRAGDLIVADTVGYHKGQRVVDEQRLILQLEFAVSRLGASSMYPRLPSCHRPEGLWPQTFAVFGG